MAAQQQADNWRATKNLLLTFATSGTSVAVATAITHPIDVVKVQQQMQAVGQRGSSSNMITTAGRLLNEGGVPALYRGVNPAVVRALSYGCLRLGLYEPCKDFIMPQDKKKQHMGHKIAAGVLSGSLATAVSNPLDIAKVRNGTKKRLQPEVARLGSYGIMYAKENFRQEEMVGFMLWNLVDVHPMRCCKDTSSSEANTESKE